MTNAHTAREWALKGLNGDEKGIAKHFVAVSTNAAEVATFGIDTSNTFRRLLGLGWRALLDGLGDWTFYDVVIGPDNFQSMLNGFHQMD